MNVKSPNRKRKKPNTEWIYGFHSAESRLSRAPETVLEAYISDKRRDVRMRGLVETLDTFNIAYSLQSNQMLSTLVDANHQGVVLKTKIEKPQSDKSLYQLLETIDHPPFLLILDQITDPHNLGACLRTADGAGVDAVVLPKDGACPVNQTVRRVASGAAESVQVYYVSNLARTLKEIKKYGVWVVGLSDDADTSLPKANLSAPIACVLGAEGRGMRKLTRDLCDQRVSIPMNGAVSSLNVSVATGIVLYSVRR